MGPTLNKDGTPRKIGSGKTKGAGCFAKIKWHQLREFISPDDEILVSRVWLREVGALNQRRGSKKKLITSLASSEKAKKSIPHPSSKKDNRNQIKNPPKDSESTEQPDDGEYNPPIFAGIGSINQY
jgi:hypothetical protein